MPHDKIKENISGLIRNIGFKEEEVEISFDENSNTLWFAIKSPNARHLLAREAEALQALNHLAQRIIEGLAEEGVVYPRAVIDANEFEKKKIDGLKALAHMMAERAKYFKSSIDVEPMSARDRRVIHEFLSIIPDIKTESVGEGKNRHIVVKYVDNRI